MNLENLRKGRILSHLKTIPFPPHPHKFVSQVRNGWKKVKVPLRGNKKISRKES